MLIGCRCTFSALTLLVGQQEEHSASKRMSDQVLYDNLSEARCK